MKTVCLFLILIAFINIIPQQVKSDQTAADNIIFSFVYTGQRTGFDFQSTGTPQQIWQDPNNPSRVHAVFNVSAMANIWSDRKVKYFFSSDMGFSWSDFGNIQTGSNARGGLGTITGLSNGRPVAAQQTNDSISAYRTQIYVRNIQETEWLRFDPGSSLIGEPLFPRILGRGDDQVYVAALSDGLCTNSLNVSQGTFSGWSCSNFTFISKAYQLAKSDDESQIGLAFTGSPDDSLSFGNLYYIKSDDGGNTWSESFTVYQYDYEGDSLGAFRGVDMTFLGDDPYIVFEVVKQDFSAGTYNDTLPNKIMLWSPALNNGNCLTLAESGVNIPFYRNISTSPELFLPVCRPAIGKSAEGEALFVIMNVVTEHQIQNWISEVSYFAGYLTYSIDKGINWSAPIKFTPETPLKDWRYISISPENYLSGNNCILQILAQADTIPGFHQNITWPYIVTAELVGITASVPLLSGADEIQNMPDQFCLFQNYPNPFNPATTIRYSLPEFSKVVIKIFDVLGNEAATLVNEEKPAGVYDITWNAADMPSGVYFCQLKAGAFAEAKKMMLTK